MKALSIVVMLSILSAATPSLAATVKLRVIETSDLHAHLMDYDYYQDSVNEKIGLVRAATLIEKARNEAVNSVLVDNGDFLQGSLIGRYIANTGIRPNEVHPVFKAMNQLNYDVGNLGDHEFSYGLPFLHESINDANFPFISANLFDTKTGNHAFNPYLIKKYKFLDTKGRSHHINIGYIGFVTPKVTLWNKKYLDGKLFTKDIVETAQKLIPRMKSQGADIIIALSHSGLSTQAYQSMTDNAVYHLARIKGIDAIAFGDSHGVFPSQDFEHIDNVNIRRGTINNIASAMPGRWGSHVGVIDLELRAELGGWRVIPIQSQTKSIFNDTALVKPNTEMKKAIAFDHDKTREFISKPMAKADNDIVSFLALVQDDASVELVNRAQKDFVENFIKNQPKLANLPVLSAAAPFRTGSRKSDPHIYTEIDSASLTVQKLAELYPYPHQLIGLKVTGAKLKEWLECSAGLFNQIDPNSTKQQRLINWNGFNTHNFDVIDGIEYQIDVTKPARYDSNCELLDFSSGRIVNLTYQGKPVDPKQIFLVATNNFRAFLGAFPGTGNENVAFVSPFENRSILADYIQNTSQESGTISTKVNNNWSLKPIETKQKLNVIFETSPSQKAVKYIKQNARHPMKILMQDDLGFGLYQIDLTKLK